MSDIKSVFRGLGGIFIMIGFVSLIALVAPLRFGEYHTTAVDGITPLLITSGIFFLTGIPLYYVFRKADPPNFKSAMVTAALSWFFISLISSIPFYMIPYNGSATMSPLSAFFESMSGWTGTGLTMVDNEAALPYTLQFWRSLIQWVGGVGVIVLTLSILARPGTGSFVLYKGEAREQKTHPSIISTVRTIWWIFLLYSILVIVALIIVGFLTSDGMSIWESINHGMTGLATGGFSVTDDSIAGYNTITQIVVTISMIFGAIAFTAHYNLLKGKIKKFLSDAQLKAMLVLITLGVISLTVLNFYNGSLAFSGNFLGALKESGFQFVSAITCTGFSSVISIDSWTESAKLIMAFAMIIGGAAGSTAGGIKLFRSILLSKGVEWRIKRAISTPRRVFVHKLGDKSLSKDDAMDLINESAIISFMWVIILSVAIVLLSTLHQDAKLGSVIFEVCSAQGNVGLTTGITNINMPDTSKIVLIFNMWIGRLEIIPIIVLIKSLFGIRKNL
ncbi:MAG: TrkH family potassium uptake protein [Candidatus Thermoplasmatota archaeon]